jgi:hypothetical protein
MVDTALAEEPLSYLSVTIVATHGECVAHRVATFE